MTLAEQLVQLAKVPESPAPVVSVYLNVRWGDEHEREQARVFLKNEIRRARHRQSGPGLAPALDWIEAQANLAAGEAHARDVHGLALFAGPASDLRQVVPVRATLESAFVVGPAPFLRPLVAALNETLAILVVFVDAESARLIAVPAEGAAEEVRLDSAVPGRHRRGGWAQLAQSRYQRHIAERRERHFEAVAETLDHLVEEHGIERIAIVGSPGVVSAFRKALSPRVSGRVAGTVSGSRHEPASEVVARATAMIGHDGDAEGQATLAAVLADAAEGSRAAAGLEAVLEAVGRGAVRRLYLLHAFREEGRACGGCGALQPGAESSCRRCGGPTTATELGDAMVRRALVADGRVTLVHADAGLARVGGVAARLRFSQ